MKKSSLPGNLGFSRISPTFSKSLVYVRKQDERLFRILKPAVNSSRDWMDSEAEQVQGIRKASIEGRILVIKQLYTPE